MWRRWTFAYIAFTDDCAFGLDEAGICRAASPHAAAKAEVMENAQRCIGAQYVATFDVEADGLLIEHPKPGTRLLFARVEEGGRVVLIRSSRLERFVSHEDVMSTHQMPTLREQELERMGDNDVTGRFSRTGQGEVFVLSVARERSA